MHQEKQGQVSKSNFPIYLSTLFLIGIVLCYILIPEFQEFLNSAWEVLKRDDEQQIKNWVSGFSWLGPIVLMLAMVVQMFLLIVPSIVLMVVSILAYGPILGSVIILLAVFLASTVGYLVGRYFSEVVIMKILGSKVENKVENFIAEYGFWAVIVTRLNPFLSNDAISFVGGIVKMGYWKFITATIMGILPLTIFIAILEENIDQLESALFWVSSVSLLALICYVIWKKYRKD